MPGDHPDPSAVLESLLASDALEEPDAAAVCQAIAQGALTDVQAGAVLTALRAKGETPEEIRGFARQMRSMAIVPEIPLPENACDIVGTGGDGAHTFNLSTGAAILAAASGVPVVKHGNRSVSSKSGAADVLEALGMPMPASDDHNRTLLAEHNFCFLFAPAHHPAAKSIAPIRKALGVRTIFNVLGPLTNPLAPKYGVIGAYSPDAAELMAWAIAGMDIERVFVVHGAPSWDEATPVGPFTLFDVRPGDARKSKRDPLDVGISRCSPDDLRGGDAQHNADAMRRVFQGERSAHRDALVLAAALALEVTGIEPERRDAVARAAAHIDDGCALRIVESLSGSADA